MKRRPPLLQVALVFETTNAYARTLLIGIGDYVLTHGPWSIHFAELGTDGRPPSWLEKWDGDGVIFRGESARIARVIDRLKVPKVDLTPSRLLADSPWVKADDAAVAQLAAQHFSERGFREFAFCGDARFRWSQHRGQRFGEWVRGRGCICHDYSAPTRLPNSDAEVDAIAEWLTGLPKPVAVFACYDNRGQQILEACRRAGLAVPEEVAVLGVDNDEVLCVLSPPPLSSVVLNPRRAGWEAAALLSLMMRGEQVSTEPRLIPPVGIETRQSSDILSVGDAKIAAALRYIREHACEGIRVDDVLRHCPMARRALEEKFRRFIGRTPRQEILRVQLNRVKELLVGTELPVGEIALRTGFEPEYLSAVFRHELKLAPTDYRRRYGLGR
jgi:LacI family transcriptional regulator